MDLKYNTGAIICPSFRDFESPIGDVFRRCFHGKVHPFFDLLRLVSVSVAGFDGIVKEVYNSVHGIVYSDYWDYGFDGDVGGGLEK